MGQVVNAHTQGSPYCILRLSRFQNQMVREAAKFGISAHLGDGEGICIAIIKNSIISDLSKFGGIILDESSILKSTDGHYRTRPTDAQSQSIPFALLQQPPLRRMALELGTMPSFWALSYTDMLATLSSPMMAAKRRNGV